MTDYSLKARMTDEKTAVRVCYDGACAMAQRAAIGK